MTEAQKEYFDMTILAERRCNKCGEQKTIDGFYKDKWSRDGFCSQCKKCRSEYQKENKEATNARARKFKENNREKINLLFRAYRDKNKEKERDRYSFYYSSHKEQVKEKDRRYRLNNPEKSRLKTAKRRALKLRAQGGGVTEEQWLGVLEKYGHGCLCCGTDRNITLDHVVPLIVGGMHDVNNVQPLCISCNSRKGAKTADYRTR